MKTIYFRVDATPQIGFGHFVRTMSIAERVVEESQIDVVFLTIANSYSEKKIEEKGYSIIRKLAEEVEESFISRAIPRNSDNSLFIDNLYNYSEEFISKLRRRIRVILFHNLCDGRFACNHFILPSAHTDEIILNDERWGRSDVEFLYGADYVVLNREVVNLDTTEKNNSSKDVIITTGGSDPSGVALKLLSFIAESNIEHVNFIFLKGRSFIHKSELNTLSKSFKGNIKIKDFSPIEFLRSQIVVSTFGVSTYELMYLGKSVLSVGHAEPNANGSSNLECRTKAIVNLGLIADLDRNTFIKNLMKLIDDHDFRNKISIKAKRIVDGKGIDRILTILLR